MQNNQAWYVVKLKEVRYGSNDRFDLNKNKWLYRKAQIRFS